MRVVNAFSANMLPAGYTLTVRFTPLSVGEARVRPELLISAIGHADTAQLFSALLGRDLAVNRETLTVADGDRLLLGQYRGPRLPEGAATLPDGARVDWYIVEITQG